MSDRHDVRPSEMPNPDQLTAVLRDAGLLGGGSVKAIAVVPFKTEVSGVHRLQLAYVGDASKGPPSVILKTAKPDRESWDSGKREVAFYRALGDGPMREFVPRCIEAVADPGTRKWRLLLEDLSASHASATEWPLPPTAEDCKRMLSALAGIHASSWNHAPDGFTDRSWLVHENREDWLQRARKAFGDFSSKFGHLLSTDRRKLYEDLLDRAPRIFERYKTHHNVTIVHGDAHSWNCLLSHQDKGDVRFFDWGSWRIDVPSHDLAYMMAMQWYRERRQRLEGDLLDHYHAALVGNGVTGYSRSALDDDYRMSTLLLIIRPLFLVGRIQPVFWWNNLERIMLAVDDLGCRVLVE